jgi:hypothetical protein
MLKLMIFIDYIILDIKQLLWHKNLIFLEKVHIFKLQKSMFFHLRNIENHITFKNQFLYLKNIIP